MCYSFFEFVVSFVGGFCVCAFVDALRMQRRVAGERRRCQCGGIGVTGICTHFILIDFSWYGTGAADPAGAGYSVAVTPLGSSPGDPGSNPGTGILLTTSLVSCFVFSCLGQFVLCFCDHLRLFPVCLSAVEWCKHARVLLACSVCVFVGF